MPATTIDVAHATDLQILQLLLEPAAFALPSSLGNVIGKPLLFSLANSWAKFYQVDTLRAHGEARKEF